MVATAAPSLWGFCDNLKYSKNIASLARYDGPHLAHLLATWEVKDE